MKVHTNNILKSAVAVLAGTLLSTAPSFAASLTNGNFETAGAVNPEIGLGFLTSSPGDTVLTPAGWTALAGQQGGGAQYIGNGIFSNNGVASRTVQLNGQNVRGGISTTVSGLVGTTLNPETVDVFFDLSANFGNGEQPSVIVSLGSAAPQTFTTIPSPDSGSTAPGAAGAIRNLIFTNYLASFVYTGGSPTATLSFVSNSGGSFGPIIDNVTLTPIPFEFSPVTGFIAGGVLFGSYKLIKRKKSVA